MYRSVGEFLWTLSKREHSNKISSNIAFSGRGGARGSSNSRGYGHRDNSHHHNHNHRHHHHHRYSSSTNDERSNK